MSIKRIEIYRGEDNQTYWRALAGNNEKVVPGEGYQRRQGAYHGVNLMLTVPADVEIVDLTGPAPMVLTADELRQLVEVTAGEEGEGIDSTEEE